MIIELTALILAFSYKNKLTDIYENSLNTVFTKGWEDQNKKVIDGFHHLEEALKCCGIHNKTDYVPFNVTEFSKGCIEHPNDGCSAKIVDLLSTNLPIVGYSLLSIFLLEFFAVLGAIALAVALKHAPDSDEEYSSSPGATIRNIVPNRRRNY